jgi:hypothetical protein
MSKTNSSHEQPQDSVITSEEALRLYREGVIRLRRPEPRIAGNGLDTNSFDFRGVRAAMDVVRAFPHENDADGHRIPADLQELRTHMGVSLTAIKAAGRRPLAGDFVAGYERMADLFTRPLEEPALPVAPSAPAN